MRINTNVNALNTLRNMQASNAAVSSSSAKLSSGFRLNKASDDAAGLAIANKLRNTGKALSAAARNAQQASAMLQVADGAVGTISSIVDRMKEIAAQSASATAGSERDKLQEEFTALNDEITRIVATTKYQGVELLNGGASAGTRVISGGTWDDVGETFAISAATVKDSTAAATYTLSSAADANGVVTLTSSVGGAAQSVLAVDGDQTLTFSDFGITVSTGQNFAIGDGTDAASFDSATIVVTAGAGGGSGPLDFMVGATGDPGGDDTLSIDLGTLAALANDDIDSQSDAETRMGDLDTLLDDVNTFIGKLGAAESRVDYAARNLASTIQNTAAAESAIRDVDMAEEMANFSKSQILSQAGTAMLAQANQSAQSVLQLLR